MVYQIETLVILCDWLSVLMLVLNRQMTSADTESYFVLVISW